MEPAPGGADPSSAALRRSEIVVLIQEIERMQTRFAHRNVTGWVRACDVVLGNCRKLLLDAEG